MFHCSRLSAPLFVVGGHGTGLIDCEVIASEIRTTIDRLAWEFDVEAPRPLS